MKTIDLALKLIYPIVGVLHFLRVGVSKLSVFVLESRVLGRETLMIRSDLGESTELSLGVGELETEFGVVEGGSVSTVGVASSRSCFRAVGSSDSVELALEGSVDRLLLGEFLLHPTEHLLGGPER